MKPARAGRFAVILMFSIGLAGPVFAETPSSSEDKPSSTSKDKSGEVKTSDLPQPVQDAGRVIKRVAKELEKATEKVISAGKAAVKDLTKKPDSTARGEGRETSGKDK